MEGTHKVLTLAVQIAIAWTLLSLLLTAFWALLLKVGSRFGSRPRPEPVAWEERQQPAEISAIYGDFVAEHAVRAHSEATETAEDEIIVLVRGTNSTRRW